MLIYIELQVWLVRKKRGKTWNGDERVVVVVQQHSSDHQILVHGLRRASTSRQIWDHQCVLSGSGFISDLQTLSGKISA